VFHAHQNVRSRHTSLVCARHKTDTRGTSSILKERWLTMIQNKTGNLFSRGCRFLYFRWSPFVRGTPLWGPGYKINPDDWMVCFSHVMDDCG
jgi:hypothetical protein